MPLIGQLYSPSNMQEQLMSATVFLVVAVIWIATMMRRSQNVELRRVILLMGILVSGWILTRTVRRQIDIETTFARYLWYSYYIFEVLLPLTVVWTANLIGTSNKSKRAPKWLAWLASFNLILIILVLTNDLHGLMFRIDLSTPGWSLRANYGYGPVYNIVFAALFLELIGGIFIFYRKVKHSPRRLGAILLLTFTIALMVYMAGYAVRIPIFVNSDLTMVTCTFTLLFFELCMQLGQIPVNRKYRKLFQIGQSKIQITDESGKPVYLSDDTKPLSPDLWEKLKNSDNAIHMDEKTLLFKNKVSGGYAVWQEDITAINILRSELEATNKNLESVNLTLSNVVHTKKQAALSRVRTELYDLLEKNVASHEKRLDVLLRSIPSDDMKRTVHFGIAALLVCFIKRESQLLIYEMNGNKTITIEDIIIYLDELVEYANLAHVECLISNNWDGELSTQRVLLLYSFFHNLLEWSAEHSLGKIIMQIASAQSRVMIKFLMSPKFFDFNLPDIISAQVAENNVLIGKENLDDMAGIWLSFPEGGEGND
jgi:hypothetical protein